jgi:hypothetical protein
MTTLAHSCLERGEEHRGGQAWEGGIVEVYVNGDMANQMFDVAFGMVLAQHLGYRPRLPNVIASDHPLMTAEVRAA